MAKEVKLYLTSKSPYAIRVVWALKLKGIEYEEVEEDLSNKSPSLLQYNPVYKLIPVLLHNRKPISESLVILEYIEETWKQTPLLSEDPYERARTRFLAKFGDEKVFKTIRFGVLLKEGKEQEEEVNATKENFKYLEEELKGKKFFGGETIGLADLALGWLAYYIKPLEEILGLKLLDQEKFPLLEAWTQDFINLPIIHENFPPQDKLTARYAAVREASLAKLSLK